MNIECRAGRLGQRIVFGTAGFYSTLFFAVSSSFFTQGWWQPSCGVQYYCTITKLSFSRTPVATFPLAERKVATSFF